MKVTAKEPIIGAIAAIGLSVLINLVLRAVHEAKGARKQLESYAAAKGITIERQVPAGYSSSRERKSD